MNVNPNKIMGTVVLCAVAASSAMAWGADAAAGKSVYAAKCRACHGANGEGNPAIAKMMKVELKPLSEAAGMSDADLKKIITEGTGKMKPVAVSGADLDNVVAFVKSLKK
ncbi:MAG TPA: cytochrome c [Bryobacteraceae bacterium]|nr:cytochrome c [Bryobacteraceae bacterium]